MASPSMVSIARSSPNEPWGFRISGGRDFRMQLQVKKVRGSLLSNYYCCMYMQSATIFEEICDSCTLRRLSQSADYF